MKKTILAILVLIIGFVGKSQITWYGIDFSNLVCYGNAEDYGILHPLSKQPKVFEPEMFLKWNDLVLLEDQKYDIKAFMKMEVKNDLVYINSLNESASILVSSDGKLIHRFQEESIKRIVSIYKMEGDGLGYVLIAQTFEKNYRRGIYWGVVFDVETKEIILMKKLMVQASDITPFYTTPLGFKNFWARSYYNALKEFGKVYRKESKKF